MSSTFQKVQVQAVEALTADAAELRLQVPKGEQSAFSYLSGQYITLRFELQGQEERRSYSLCSAPEQSSKDGLLRVGIKRLKGGLVSNYILDNIKAGQSIDISQPEGRFVFKPKLENKRDIFLFAGGSGITPLLSIIKTALEEEPKSSVYLYYANRDETSIMFHEELQLLEKRHAGQFLLQQILSQPKTEKSGGIFGLFAREKTNWRGEKGRISKMHIARFLQEYRAEDQREALFYICGPEGMMQTVEQSLLALGIEKKTIKTESFGGQIAPKLESKTAQAAAGQTTLIAHIEGQRIELAMDANETVVAALRRNGYEPPFSCLSGACSTCMAKVLQGEVEMERCLALDESEIAEGFVLTCSSKPKTALIEIDYDV